MGYEKKGDLSDFERGISDTADLLGLSCTTISRDYREWSEKGKTSSEQQFCARKCLVDARGQRRMARVLCRRASLNSQHVKQMGYSSRRPHRVPLLSAKNRKLRLQFTNWTIEDWKNVSWSDECRFLLRHSDGRVRIWNQQHESMDHCKATAYLSIVADHAHPFMTTVYPSSDG
uniref:Transposase Tc1-like domain-containing protein n=1 Tax=Denticeps clupeoides TaxID=299321 RepID=A0AAY4CXQ8_9TELE